MSNYVTGDRAREIRSWPSATLDHFREALFAAASGDVATSFGPFVNRPTLDLVTPSISAGEDMNLALHPLAQRLAARTRELLIATDALDLAAVLQLVGEVIEAADELRLEAERLEETTQ